MFKEQDNVIEFQGQKFNGRHGGPFDRGSADSYYGRPFRPHYFLGGTYDGAEILITETDSDAYRDYKAGYEWNEEFGDKKNWG